MARVYLDTNYYIDALYRNPEVNRWFVGSEVYFSPLSVHILFYALKLKIPFEKMVDIMNKFQSVDLTSSILTRAMIGPTDDLEDNIQLHSAVDSEADIFLTHDKKLLGMKFFGKMRIKDKF